MYERIKKPKPSSVQVVTSFISQEVRPRRCDFKLINRVFKTQYQTHSRQGQTCHKNIAQRTIWKWDSSKRFWEPIETKGMPTYPPFEKGEKHGELVATGGESMLQTFISLQDDMKKNYYKVTIESEPKINVSGISKNFKNQSGKSVQDAVEQALEVLELDGSTSADYSRHDYQPASKSVENLQIQLGGSKLKYRQGKGDTSCTVVIVNARLFEKMAKLDPMRWKQVLRTAHTKSYNEQVKVTIE